MTTTTESPPRRSGSDPVGVLEVADRLGVKDRTVHMWLFRNLMPDPDFDTVNGSRAWEWRTVLKWAGENGKTYTESSREEYQRRFRRKPAPPPPQSGLPKSLRSS